MSAFTKALEEELQVLESELAKDPRYRRAALVRETLAAYRPQEKLDAPRGYKLVPLTKEERIRIESAAYIETFDDKRVHRRRIGEHIAKLGLLEPDRAYRSLAVYFARWPEFVSDGKGWVVLNEAKKANEAAAE